MDDESQFSQRQKRLGEAIAELLLARDEQENFDTAAWLTRYNDLQEPLQEFLRHDSLVASRLNASETQANHPIKSLTRGEPIDALDIPRTLGAYLLIGELGRGGMGIVYAARDSRLDREVALKCLKHDPETYDADYRRFCREAEAVARLDHPNIVPIYEVGETSSIAFFTMKRFSGGTLKDWLAPDAKHSHRKIVAVAQSIASAIQHAHERGILRRDLKPSNILLDEYQSPYISDFGLAKDLDLDETTVGTVLGTPAYMAPEQARGNPTTASDIYAIGAILYALLTKRPPFLARTLHDLSQQLDLIPPVAPRKIDPNIPPDIETICLKCLSKNPEHRYLTAKELSDDLNRWLNHEPIQAKPVSLWMRSRLWCRRNPATAAAILISLISTGAVISALSLSLHQADRDRRSILAEKEAANRNLKLAGQAIDELLSQVQDELSVFPAIDPVRKKMLQRAVSLQEEILQSYPDASTASMDILMTKYRMAQLNHSLGELALATESLQSARSVYDRVSANSSEWVGVLGHTSSPLQSRQSLLCSMMQLEGNILQDQGKFAAAETAFSQAIGVMEKDSEDSPWPIDMEFGYVVALRQRAVLISKRSHPESLLEFRRTLDATLDLQTRFPKLKPPQQRRLSELLANANNSYAIALRADGKIDDAIQHYRIAIEILENLQKLEPLSHSQKLSLAGSHTNLGNVYFQRGTFQEASDEYVAAFRLGERLVFENPGRVLSKQRLVGALIGAGLAKYNLGDAEQATEWYDQALERLAEFGQQHPEMESMWRSEQGRVFVNYVNCLIVLKRFEEALDMAKRALRTRQERSSFDLDGGHAASELGLAWSNQGTVYESMNNVGDAIGSWNEAIRCHERAIEQNPNNRQFLSRLDFDIRKIVFSHIRAGEWSQAKDFIQTQQNLVQTAPELSLQLRKDIERQAQEQGWDQDRIEDLFTSDAEATQRDVE